MGNVGAELLRPSRLAISRLAALTASLDALNTVNKAAVDRLDDPAAASIRNLRQSGSGVNTAKL
jgi:hypothetical protein